MLSKKELNNLNEYAKKDLNHIVKMVAETLNDNRILVLEGVNGKLHHGAEDIARAKKIISWIEKTWKMLDGYSRLIIEIDVIRRFENINYLEYMSKSQYYRYKYIAYYEFKCALN